MLRRGAILVALIAATQVATFSQQLPQLTGAVAAWEKMLKLRTTASVMHITAHPDDEHGGVLAKLSLGDGARVTLLTLNRGESGDNAIGPQLFDALGLIRTEELLAADRYYGVDQQYFTTVVDYGYSKRLEETLDKWGRETVLRDVVRIIRMERPTILISRFQGNERDGHGNHSAAGLMAREAFRAAADPSRYTDQLLKEGLRPWQPAKLFIGGVRESEEWTVRIDSGEYSPVLGDSFGNIARRGLSFQRSQNGGQFTPTSGSAYSYYSDGAGTSKDAPLHSAATTFYDGLPTTLERTIGTVGKPIDDAIASAVAAFSMTNPAASVSRLAVGLKLTREAKTQLTDPDALHVLAIKEQQFQDAINAAAGAVLTAVTNPPLMGAPVPGQTFAVDARLDVRIKDVTTSAPVLISETGWRVETASPNSFKVTLADDVAISTRPYFYRNGLQESQYTLRDAAQFGRPVTPAPLVASATYLIDGVSVEVRETVKRREARLPYGDVVREVRSVPRIAVAITPATAIVPFDSASPKKGSPPPSVDVEVTLLNNAESGAAGKLTLKMPVGWKNEPASFPFSFARPGERASYRFTVRPTTVDAKPYQIEAVATADKKEYREGSELIDHRDLELRYLYRAATTEVRGVNVTTVPGLKVGYVMGIGDAVPRGLQQLGAQVTLLGERDLASGDLSSFDAIITGTRAYAVREDLTTYNSRLLDYVKAGGNMIVLYNTQELVPNAFAPFPGELPRGAEEVSEEDSPVTILTPTHQSFNWPNKITTADFNGWVEQRGSKFFTKWDAAYTPMISTFDKGQSPQSGGWLTARVEKGYWTYFAYALHRQLPYGVAGAYRITANLLALNKEPR